VIELIDGFEREMSPRRLFEREPLSAYDERTVAILSDLAHQLWLVRHPVATWVDTARAAAATLQCEYERLENLAPLDENGSVAADFARQFNRFRSACRALATAIERFPSRILVT
jgi:hypothetical protein